MIADFGNHNHEGGVGCAGAGGEGGGDEGKTWTMELVLIC